MQFRSVGGFMRATLDSTGTFNVTNFLGLGTTTVSALPAAAARNAGQMIKVSDSTARCRRPDLRRRRRGESWPFRTELSGSVSKLGKRHRAGC